MLGKNGEIVRELANKEEDLRSWKPKVLRTQVDKETEMKKRREESFFRCVSRSHSLDYLKQKRRYK